MKRYEDKQHILCDNVKLISVVLTIIENFPFTLNSCHKNKRQLLTYIRMHSDTLYLAVICLTFLIDFLCCLKKKYSVPYSACCPQLEPKKAETQGCNLCSFSLFVVFNLCGVFLCCLPLFLNFRRGSKDKNSNAPTILHHLKTRANTNSVLQFSDCVELNYIMWSTFYFVITQ